VIPIRINPSSDIPIYKQIVEQFKFQILSGEMKPHEKLPGSRALAVELKVNPLTIQKAYQELRNLELIYNKRGEGTFVSEIDISGKDPRVDEVKEKVRALLMLTQTYALKKDQVEKIFVAEIKRWKGENNDS
jgi:GntR family transcriptional regulator